MFCHIFVYGFKNFVRSGRWWLRRYFRRARDFYKSICRLSTDRFARIWPNRQWKFTFEHQLACQIVLADPFIAELNHNQTIDSSTGFVDFILIPLKLKCLNHNLTTNSSLKMSNSSTTTTNEHFYARYFSNLSKSLLEKLEDILSMTRTSSISSAPNLDDIGTFFRSVGFDEFNFSLGGGGDDDCQADRLMLKIDELQFARMIRQVKAVLVNMSLVWVGEGRVFVRRRPPRQTERRRRVWAGISAALFFRQCY